MSVILCTGKGQDQAAPRILSQRGLMAIAGHFSGV